MEGNDPGAVEELELIRRAQHGDHEAYRRLVISYESRLLAYLTHLLGDRENARDIAQETFIAAFHALPRWNPPERQKKSRSDDQEQDDAARIHPLAPWLYRIATNRALNLLQRQPVHSSLLERDALYEQQRSSEQNPTIEDRFIARELLREALGQLSELDAACLILRFVSGAGYTEIALQLGITKEAARKRVTRGLTALRAAYRAVDMEVHA